jgi:hypothetical protein
MSRTPQITITIAPLHLEPLRRLAVERGVSLAHVVRAAVAAYLDPVAQGRSLPTYPPQMVTIPAIGPPPVDPLTPRC